MHLLKHNKYFIIFLSINLIKLQLINGTIITSVNFLFETFSPYGIIRFFEFSDKEWNVSENCIKDMYQYLEGLQKGSIWAIKLYDSTGYYGGGGFGGHKFRISNSEQCKQLQLEYFKSIRTHWNIRSNVSTVPFPVHLILAKYEIEMATKFLEPYVIQQSICFPKACGLNDLKEILSTHFFRSNHIIKNMTLLDYRLVNGDYNIFEDGAFYALISIICIAIILLICAHFSDFWSFLDDEIYDSGGNDKDYSKSTKENQQKKHEITSSLPINAANCNTTNDLNCTALEIKKKICNNVISNQQNSITKLNIEPLAESFTINNMNSNKHVNLVKVKKIKTEKTATICLDILADKCDYVRSSQKSSLNDNNFVQQILGAFSLQSNLNELLELHRIEYEIKSVRGLQLLFTIFMILANTCIILNFISNNDIIQDKSSFNFIKANQDYASYLIDMFFFLCGANLTYMYFKTSSKNSIQFVDQLLHFCLMIAYKIFSLIMPCIVVVFCLELSSKYFYNNVVLEIPSVDYHTCEATKWRNIFFIDTFFPIDKRCMPWSWYISFEVHFFIAACLVLLLARIHPKYAGAICTGLFIICIMASIIVEMEMSSKFILGKSFQQEIADLNLIFDKVWLRIPPYLLGMCLGYTLYKTRGKLDMNIFVIVFGWIACFLIIIGFVFGSQFLLWRLHPWLKATIITLGHTIWAMILFWIVLASISQHGGILSRIITSKCFCILGKLSNCTLLLHPLILRIAILNGESGIYLSSFQIIIMFLGITILSYAFSLLLYLLFEAPLVEFLRIIYNYKSKLCK